MKKIKFLEIADYNVGALRPIQDYLKSQGIEVESETLKSMQVPELIANDYQQLKNYDLVKLSFENSMQILENWSTQPSQVKILGCCDVFIKEANSLWPRVILYDSLRECIVTKMNDHDIKEAGYVVCNDLRGRALVSLLLSLGHKQVFLVGENDRFIQSEVQHLKRFHIGNEIASLPTHQLTLQQTRASILINAISLKDNSSLMNDLVYFNFMKENSTVLDLDFSDAKGGLIEEAQKASLKIIPKEFLAAYYDFSILKKLQLVPSATFEDFHKSWMASSLPVS